MNASAPLILRSEEEGDILLPGRTVPAVGSCSFLASLDYDGTLRRKNGRPEDVDMRSFPLLGQLRRHGVRWGINTGRCLSDMAEALRFLPLQPDFLCTCERYVYLAGADGLLHPLTQYNAQCLAANARLRSEALPAWNAALDSLRCELPHAQWNIADTDALSIVAKDSETMDLLMPRILELASSLPGVAAQRAGKYLRLSDARFNKGTALRAVISAWHVPEKRLFLMGDGHNDLDAFRLFPSAFCAVPADAHSDVLHWISQHHGRLFPDVSTALLAWGDTFSSALVSE